MGHHRGLCNLVYVYKETLGITPCDRILQCASLSFDAAVWEIFMALGTGLRLCFVIAIHGNPVNLSRGLLSNKK